MNVFQILILTFYLYSSNTLNAGPFTHYSVELIRVTEAGEKLPLNLLVQVQSDL